MTLLEERKGERELCGLQGVSSRQWIKVYEWPYALKAGSGKNKINEGLVPSVFYLEQTF